MDIPDSVLSQLNNRIQHSLRAYTPAEIKNVKAAAQSFRENPAFNTADVITELKTGEALVSCLDEDGKPSIVEKATICPPQSYMGAIDADRRKSVIEYSELYGKYEVFEAENKVTAKKGSSKKSVVERAATNAMSTLTRETTKDLVDSFLLGKDTSRRQSSVQKAANSAIRTLSGELGKTLTRGLFGILKGR